MYIYYFKVISLSCICGCLCQYEGFMLVCKRQKSLSRERNEFKILLVDLPRKGFTPAHDRAGYNNTSFSFTPQRVLRQG